jgi:3-hydroxyisobutyrate dehydrogenase-like beta-hydroxyacid dehydrogenase
MLYKDKVVKMNKLKIGFIGFGEAAFNIAKGLNKEIGPNNIFAYDKNLDKEPYLKLIKSRATEANVTLLRNIKELIDIVDIIFCAVSADMVVPIAKESLPFLRSGQIYADINAASPVAKKQASEIISKSGANYVDISVMASIPVYGHKVPLVVSGKGARQFTDILNKYNMKIKYYGEEPGNASAIKMFRSIFMKGIAMLLLETIVASHEYGMEDDVWDSILETLTGSYPERINQWITRTVIHSERREHEMGEVVSLLKELETDNLMSLATKNKMRWCTNLHLRDYFKGIPPKDFHEVLKAIDDMKKQ